MGSAVFWRLASGSVITKAEKAHTSRDFNCEGLCGWGNAPLCNFYCRVERCAVSL